MAFPSAGGWGNLPNGNFSPTIFSKKAQKAFRKSSVVEDITNTDFAGELSAYGDSVRIIKEPDIVINNLKRGTDIVQQDLMDQDFSMIIDQANYFSFQLDDIEEAHGHVNFMDLATDRAGYRLRDTFDAEVLGYMSGYEWNGTAWVARTAPSGIKQDDTADADELLAANKLDASTFDAAGTAGDSIALAPNTDNGVSPLQLLNRMKRKLDMANVESENRWVVCDPVFVELLLDEDAKLVNHDWGGESEVRNGRLPNTIRGFRVYQSNNLPYLGGGPDVISSGSADDLGILVAGHDSAVATAEQIAKTEKFRSPDRFSDVVRGMQLYGRKILRSESLLTAKYNVA